MSQNKSYPFLLALTLCLATTAAHAQTESDPMPELVAETVAPMEIFIVTGTRAPQPLKQSLAHSTVITQQEIQDSQAADVPTLLKSLAGVEFYQSGGVGQQSSVFMRGTNSSHVLILLDGVRINSATTGATAIDQLMLDQIERIEVVRGNVSSVYGSEAIGGVIQIFTKRGYGEPSLSINSGIGSHNTQRASAGFGGKVSDTQFNVQVSKFHTDGVSAINATLVPNIQQDKDGYDNTSLSANVRHALTADHSLSGSLFNSRGEVQYDSAFDGPTDEHISKPTLSKFSLASDNQLTEIWHSKLQLAQGMDNAKNYLNGAEKSNFKTTHRQITWLNTVAVHSEGKVVVGLENLKQRVAASTAYTQTDRQINSLFAGYTGNYGAHQVQTNLRQDRYSDFGKANTGLLGYGYAITDTLRATASTSNAFKAPTFNDLYYPLFGNPNLKGERSKNHEVGLRYANDQQHVNVIYFDTRFKDLIAADSSNITNIKKARVDGIELSYAGQFTSTGLKAAYTHQNPRDEKTDLPLLRRSKNFANLGITQQMNTWKIGGEAQYSGTRADYHIVDLDANFNSIRVTLPGYTLFNLSADYRLDKHAKLSLRADNIFNKNYQLAHGYNTLGRAIFTSLNYQQ